MYKIFALVLAVVALFVFVPDAYATLLPADSGMTYIHRVSGNAADRNLPFPYTLRLQTSPGNRFVVIDAATREIVTREDHFGEAILGSHTFNAEEKYMRIDALAPSSILETTMYLRHGEALVAIRQNLVSVMNVRTFDMDSQLSILGDEHRKYTPSVRHVSGVSSSSAGPTIRVTDYRVNIGFSQSSNPAAWTNPLVVEGTWHREIEVDPVEYFTKVLRLPAGTTVPAASFDFSFSPVQVQLSSDSGLNSRPVAEVPTITNQTITLNPATATPSNPVAGDTVEVRGNLDLRALLASINFPGGGVYAWEVRELAGSSQTVAPSQMSYDDARFQLRAHIDRNGNLFALEIFELNYDEGSWTLGIKRDDGMSFHNTYRRLAGGQNQAAFEVSKSVAGEFANHTLPFSFTLVLTSHPLAPVDFENLEALIYNADGSRQSAVSISGPTVHFNLNHGQRFVIPEVFAGTTFAVSEAASLEYAPSVSVFVGGQMVHSAAAGANTALATGSRLIVDTGRNAADFSNTHQSTPITGLIVANAPWIALGVVVAGLSAVVLIKRREGKRSQF